MTNPKNKMTKALAVLTALMALFLGSLFGMMLGGFGIWAAPLSVGSLLAALMSGVVISWVSAVTLSRRWLAATLFSLPLPLVAGLVFAAAAQEWWRCLAVLLVLILPFVVVGQLSFAHGPYRDQDV